MKMLIDSNEFIQQFKAYGRMADWSSEGLDTLFNYLDESAPEMDLDVIGICCEWSEYDSALAAAEDYGFEPDKDDAEDDIQTMALKWLHDSTTVVELPSRGVVIQQF